MANYKAVILLGAGASTSFFDEKLNSKHLHDSLLSRDCWERIIEKYHNGNPDDSIDIDALLKGLASIAGAKTYSFEDLVDIYDKVSFMLTPSLYQGSDFAEAEKIARTSVLSNEHGGEYRNLPFLMRSIICDEVNRFCVNRNDPKYISMRELQRNFITTIEKDFSNINVSNLNYDDTFQDSVRGLDFSIGFEFSFFDKQQFLIAPKSLSYLHGSIHFCPLNHSICGLSSCVKYCEDLLGADLERFAVLSSSQPLSSNGDGFPDYNTYITTGRTKDMHFNSHPYATYYAKLASDLQTADVLFVIGYSFHDSHINRLLSTFDRTKVRSVAIIDYDVNLNVAESITSSTGKIHKILESFDEPFFLSSSLYELAEMQSQIDIKGYCNLSPSMFYYSKGYKAFLSEDIDNVFHSQIAPFI